MRATFVVPVLALLPLAVATGAKTPAGDAARGAALYRERCALCHGEGGQRGGLGPPLAGVVGRRAGSAAGFGYSNAMRAAGERGLRWNAAALDRFLAGPATAVPGTSMALATASREERRDLVAYLATLRPPAGAAGGTPAKATGARRLTAAVASGSWRDDAPGVRRHLTLSDLPAPYATASAGNPPQVVAAPDGAALHVPDGFAVALFARGLENPRLLRIAPNGDVFLAETAAGRIRVLRAAPGAWQPERTGVFAQGLDGPFGIAFYPPGASPSWVYVAEANRVVRFPYQPGDLAARGPFEVVVASLTPSTGGHTTRDVAFSPDGKRMFVSVGSASNAGEGMGAKSADEVKTWEAANGLGATWGGDTRRADVLVFAPDGSGGRIFASGLRNCVGMAVHPSTGDLWCATNERDGLGDDLVPDFATRVREGASYGWPWYYLGANEDPRRRGERPDLASRVTVPDVLFQSHSASLQMTFYDALPDAPAAFPDAYQGDGFAAFHGSWNRTQRTGYKVVRILLKDGVPTGEYEDFLTGFVVDDARVWGRPVGVAVARDGALLVSEDGNGSVWRVAPGPGPGGAAGAAPTGRGSGCGG
jgi:glucose/arabinose dehydrogenase/cytochrome c2